METYILTDGDEVFETRAMTYEDYLQANTDAYYATDGNIYWAKVSVVRRREGRK